MKYQYLPIFIFSLLIINACGEDKINDKVKNEILVKTEIVKSEKISIPIRTTGRLSAAQESNMSFKIPGIIKKFYVKEGQTVTKGMMLAALDLSEIDANLNKAKTSLEKVNRDFERVKNLYEDKVASLEQFQDMKTALDVAESDHRIAKFNYEYSVIKAPANGKILRKITEENELVNAGFPVIIFGSSENNWKMNIGLSDVDIVKVNIGDLADIHFDAFPGEVFKAKIIETGKAADPATGTYQVSLQLNNYDERLSSGFIGKVEIYPAEKSEMILIPIEALTNANHRSAFVYLLGNDSKVNKTPVEIFEILGDKIILKSGLTEGQEIVTTGSEYLQQGSKISIKN